MTTPRRIPQIPLIVDIIIVLIAIAALGVNYLARTRACTHEYHYVQAALNAYMADNNLQRVAASLGTHDMTSPVLLYFDGTLTNPSYVRDSQTHWSYAWDGTGRITRIIASSSGPGVPPGCVVSPPR
jgi:hypothetical protein